MKYELANPLDGAVLKPYELGGNIMQYFGENPQLYDSIPGYPQGMGHNGIDISLPWGTPVKAAHDGIVLGLVDNLNPTVRSGNSIQLHSLDFIDSDSNKTVKCITSYFHLRQGLLVTLGQQVKKGDIMGYEGNTGFVVTTTPYWKANPHAGAHLHFGVSFHEKIGQDNYRPINTAWGVATVDPCPYLGIPDRDDLRVGILTQIRDLYLKLIDIVKGRKTI